ncbi:MAG: hypothetical protein SFU98_22045 [Leptospiraceae bacterium]|nr:hypothetical protein [Leptospiraceae bacterium]
MINNSTKETIRVYFSFYLSVILHFVFFLILFFPISKQLGIICGIHIPVEIEEKERSLSFEFDLEGGSSSEEQVQKTKTQDSTEKETGKVQGKNPSFDSDKYKEGEWKDLVENLEKTKDLRKNFLDTKDKLLLGNNYSESYVNRNRHYEDMIVKEILPTLFSIDKPFSEEIKKAVDNLERHRERNRIVEEFRNPDFQNPMRMEIEKKIAKPKFAPLEMDSKEREEYFDNILTETKEEQLNEFINRFSNYDPNEGDLPLVYRDLYYKNLQRLAYTFSSDPTYFSIDYFEENLNKEDYLKNAMELASKFKGTKTGTEILFTILDIFEIQERALLQLFQVKEHLKTIDPNSKEIRIETLKRIVEKYDKVLAEKKIENFSIAQDLYHKKKLQIVDFLLENQKDYRSSDAHFEKGRILWERGIQKNDDTLIRQAVDEWKLSRDDSKSSSEFLNKKTLNEVLQIFEKQGKNQNTISQINLALQMRLRESMEEKRKREERLLWKKQ